MRLCLVMLAKVKVEEGEILLDKKNIKVIERYLKYFKYIQVVARKTIDETSLYPREVYKNDRVSFSLYKELRNPTNLLSYIFNFKKVLNKSLDKSDVVLCWGEPKTNIIVKQSKNAKKNIIVYVGSCTKDSLMSKNSILKKIAGTVLFPFIKNGVKKADYVHYVTNQELQKKYPSDKPQIGASYVDVNTYISLKEKNEKIESYQEGKLYFTIGLIGYLNEIKGIDTAIRALSKLDENYKLKILGGGSRKYYKKLAQKYNVSDRVLFEGTLPPGDSVTAWLKSIDIYIQPSRTEGLPRATIEAMSTGCPVISSSVGGLVELTDKRYLHLPGDWKKLALHIYHLSKDKEELMKQSARSFKTAQKYNRIILDQKIDHFFEEIIKNTEC